MANKHHLQVRDEDFDRAAGGGAKSGALKAQIRRSTLRAILEMSCKKRHKPLGIKGLCKTLPIFAIAYHPL